MIVRRVAAPGPRTVALHRPPLVALILIVAVFVAACGASVPSGVTFSSGPGSSGPRSSEPGSTVSGSTAPGSVEPGPSQPRWPGTTVLAVIALGAADGEIQKAGTDLQRAAEAQDLQAMWGAADGLANLVDALIPNLERLDVYEGTKPVADRYRAAFPDIGGGAKQLRDAITGGDPSGVVAGSQRIAKGLQAYAPIRREIAALVEQAIVQQRLLVR